MMKIEGLSLWNNNQWVRRTISRGVVWAQLTKTVTTVKNEKHSRVFHAPRTTTINHVVKYS